MPSDDIADMDCASIFFVGVYLLCMGAAEQLTQFLSWVFQSMKGLPILINCHKQLSHLHI